MMVIKLAKIGLIMTYCHLQKKELKQNQKNQLVEKFLSLMMGIKPLNQGK